MLHFQEISFLDALTCTIGTDAQYDVARHIEKKSKGGRLFLDGQGGAVFEHTGILIQPFP